MTFCTNKTFQANLGKGNEEEILFWSILIPMKAKGPFTYSNENAFIEVSSTFHRAFIEFFVVLHEFF